MELVRQWTTTSLSFQMCHSRKAFEKWWDIVENTYAGIDQKETAYLAYCKGRKDEKRLNRKKAEPRWEKGNCVEVLLDGKWHMARLATDAEFEAEIGVWRVRVTPDKIRSIKPGQG